MADDRDEFWDLSSLVPPKKKRAVALFAGIDELPEIESGREAEKKDGNRLHFPAPEDPAATAIRSFTPDNPLLAGVRVAERTGTYQFYHSFRETGMAFQQRKGSPCPFAPFFSYIPQYSQLSEEQAAYYLYFRDQANNGCFIDTNLSYLLLYVYEIINLPDVIPPEIGTLRLARIWSAYRKKIPQIEKYLIQWLMDYCLVFHQPCPNEILAPFLPDIVEAAPIKEFYLGTAPGYEECRYEALIGQASDYHYRYGRYTQGEYKDLFLTHIRESVKGVIDSFFTAEMLPMTSVDRTYEAFAGALNAGNKKYRLDVLYYPVAAPGTMRVVVTAAVKYAENKIRAHLAIKSRLSVNALPQKYKEMIDTYFDKVWENVAVAPVREAYEALYDAPTNTFSAQDAQQIEQTSWENTRLLIPEEEAEEIFSPAAEEKTEMPDGIPEKEEIAFLGILWHCGFDAARKYAEEVRRDPLALGEKINEFFADRIGDIVIDTADFPPSPVTDYETEVEDLLRSFPNDDGK